MKVTLLALVAALAGSFANPTPEIKDEKRDARMVDDEPYYVINPEVPYPWRFHDHIFARHHLPAHYLPSFRSKLNPGAQFLGAEGRAPQTSSSTTPTTTSIFGIGSIPSLGTIPSFTSIFPVSGARCATTSGDDGVCLTQGECDSQGGIKDGNCGTILFASAGVCCSFVIKKCSDTAIRSPLTWMTPPRANGKISCTLTFPANPGLTVAGTTIGGGLTSSSNSIRTCQLKIEFDMFRLAGPNPNTTVCDEDYFGAVGSATPMPRLCGDSFMDQHVYLSFNSEQDDITLGFFLSDASNKDWRLKITRIPCSSQDLAPTNCLQYMTKTAGQIESFNFRQEYPGSVRQLANQDYNICFKRSSGFCAVCFAPCQSHKGVPGFLLSKSATNTTSAVGGANCPDQLIVPGGTDGNNIRESVYCGSAFNGEAGASVDANICTTSDRITYLTDAKEETGEINNAGFCLTYTQKKC